jgi:tryptophan synthase alpha chain
LNRAALIPFFVIGDPDEQTSLELVKTAIDAGADVLELGIPFSDPVADGPTIQKADIRAKAGMTPAKALAFIKRVTDYRPSPSACWSITT